MSRNYVAHIQTTGDISRGCQLIICPGSHDQSGSKLTATVTAILKRYKKPCPIILADELDRHNFMALKGINESQAQKEAVLRGAQWLEQHKDILDSFYQGEYAITRWDQIKNHRTFKQRLSVFTEMYYDLDDASVQNKINEICNKHVDVVCLREARRGTVDRTQHNTIFQASVSYMLEELAGLSTVREQNDAPEIYPGECFLDPHYFHTLCNTKEVSLRLPEVLKVTFVRT